MVAVKQIALKEEKHFNGKAFPLTLTIDDGNCSDLCTWISSHRKELDDMLREHSAILFRGIADLKSHNEFHEVVVSTDYEEMSYLGGAAVRTQLTERVFTANESPSSENIPFHHEMAQTPDPPTHLFFYCETAPVNGGETPILISAEVCERMFAKHPEFMTHVEKAGVQYVRVMPEEDDPHSAIGRGWKSTFLAQDRDTAEKSLTKLGSSWEWLEDGCCKTITTAVPAVRIDNEGDGVRSNRKTFFNSMVAAFTGWNDTRNEGSKAVITADDGQPLDAAAMSDAEQIMNEVCVAFRWQAGDVLLVDNRTCMHSRRNFEGPRRILASLARDKNR